MLDSNLMNEIISCETFDKARSLFIELYQNKDIAKKQKIEMLDLLQFKVQTQNDAYVLIDFYERIGAKEQLFQYINKCDFKDEPMIRTKIISIYRKYGNEYDATGLIKKQPVNKISLNQKSANLNKLGMPIESREEIETLIINKGISNYNIKTYASIINNLTKNDDYANEVLLPNVARDICKSNEISNFTITLFLKRLYKYEDGIGNKKQAKIVEQILENCNKSNS